MNRRSGLIGGLLLVMLGLTACSSTPSRQSASEKDTLGRIDAQLSTAAASIKSAAAAQTQAQDAMLPPLQVELPQAVKEVAEPRFDLAVSEAPAAQVFMALVSDTPYSMLIPPDVSGEISVSLKNVTVREALESIRDAYGYDFKVAGNRIQVKSNAIQTRVFEVNYLVGKRSGSSDLRVTGTSISSLGGRGVSGSTAATGGAANSSNGSTGQSVDASRVSMTSESDFWGELKTALLAIMGDDGGRAVIVNPQSGVILVRGMPQEIRSVERYLRTTQLIIERQVMLEAKIVDVELSEGFQSGVNWAAFGSSKGRRGAVGVAGASANLATSGAISSGTTAITPGALGAVSTGTSGAGFFGLSLQTDDFSSLIQFLETQGNVQVLSSPRIATLNNQKAVLKVGADEYYVTNITTTTTTSSSGGATTSPSITLQPFFSGISLDVTPQIDENDSIILHVHPSVSVVAEKQKTIDLGSLGNFVLPLAASNINETDSVVRVRDGQIVAIGGLMKQTQADTVAQVPGLGDVPVAGGLFGQRAESFTKRELVILIKPTVIKDDANWGQDIAETQARIREYRRPSSASAADHK